MKLIVWLIVSTVSAAAWAGSAAEPQAEVSTEILRSALKKYQGLESLEVGFKQVKTLKDMDFKVESEGEMSIHMPDRVIWKVTKPAPLQVEMNREEISIDSGGAKNRIDTAAIPAGQKQEFLNMFNWLKLDADALARSYRVGQAGPGSYVFTSRDPGALFKSMAMTLDKGGMLQSVLFTEKSDDQMLLRFGKPIMKYAKKQK